MLQGTGQLIWNYLQGWGRGLQMLQSATSLDAEGVSSLVQADQAILDAMPVGVYLCDGEGRIVRVNRAAIDMWGRKPGFFDGAQRFCGSFKVESLDGVCILPEATPMAQAVRNGASFDDQEAWVENPDGRRWVASVTIRPLHDAYGQVVGAVNCFRDITREYQQRELLARQRKDFHLAMVASKMGTWRYTMADNICLYDENAQRLYGLTQARFLHDEEGVKAKFHPDDMELMWSRVAKACAIEGDGLYDVEYRVKQPDGSWRWLSAWGYVEFEGKGETRKPVAITGASRDITELVKAGEAQKVLIDELNHRVKNMLATVQSIAMQTQRSTPAAFAERFEARLMALSRTHDLLTRSQWTGVALRQLLEQAFAPYCGDMEAPISLTGSDMILPTGTGLALAMVMHELATNAAKYGALSNPQGRINIAWSADVRDKKTWLSLAWKESDGPPVAKPSRSGFGSRLIEYSIGKELGGEAGLQFLPDGLHCTLAFPLDDGEQ
jgi:two-component sensor histidine kinase